MRTRIQITAILLVVCTLGFAQIPALVNDINMDNSSTNDVNGGLNGSGPINFIEYNNELFFLATAETPVRRKLFKGYGNNLVNVSATLGGFPESITEAVVFNDSIYLTSVGKLYHTTGQSLLGSSSIQEVDLGGVKVIDNLTVFNGKLYFAGFTDATGSELYSYSNGVTSLVADLAGGSVSFNPNHLIVVNNTLLFRRLDEARWWRYTGTGTPTGLANAVYRNTWDYTVYNNKLYFSAETDVTRGSFTRTETLLFETDGSFRAPNVVAGFEFIFNVNDLGIYKNQLVFDGRIFNGNIPESILGFYNGSTYTKVDKNGYVNAGDFTENNDTLYFYAADSGNDFELWRYVEGGLPTEQVEINPVGNSLPRNFFSFENNLFFSANNGTEGTELWAVGPDFKGNPTGLFNLSKSINSLSIYPNPASNNIHTEKGRLEILDLTGNSVLVSESNGLVDVSNLMPGIYTVLQNNKRTKLIVE